MTRLLLLIIPKTLKEAGKLMEMTWGGHQRGSPHNRFIISPVHLIDLGFSLKKEKTFQVLSGCFNLFCSEQPLFLWVCRHEQPFPPSRMTCEECQHSPLYTLRNLEIAGNGHSGPVRICIVNIVHNALQFLLDVSNCFSRSNRFTCGCAGMNSPFPHHVWLVKNVSIDHYVDCTLRDLEIAGNGHREPVRIRIDNIVHSVLQFLLDVSTCFSRINRYAFGCAGTNSRLLHHVWLVKNTIIDHYVLWETWILLAMALVEVSWFISIISSDGCTNWGDPERRECILRVATGDPFSLKSSNAFRTLCKNDLATSSKHVIPISLINRYDKHCVYRNT